MKQWLTNPTRRTFLRNFLQSLRYATATILLLWLMGRVPEIWMTGWGQEDRHWSSPSPSGERTAVLFEGGSAGATTSADYIVKIEKSTGGRRSRMKEVWRAYGIAPARLEWHGNDSLIVIVRKSTRNADRWKGIRVRPGVLQFVGTEERSVVADGG
jgi:hypothetical protein